MSKVPGSNCSNPVGFCLYHGSKNRFKFFQVPFLSLWALRQLVVTIPWSFDFIVHLSLVQNVDIGYVFVKCSVGAKLLVDAFLIGQRGFDWCHRLICGKPKDRRTIFLLKRSSVLPRRWQYIRFWNVSYLTKML